MSKSMLLWALVVFDIPMLIWILVLAIRINRGFKELENFYNHKG